MAADFPFFIGGERIRTAEPLDVRNPFDNSIVGRTWLAGDAEFDRAADLAAGAAETMRRLPAYERAEILMRASKEILARKDGIATVLAGEAGKPIKDARTETERAAMTFHVAAEEARRLSGEVVPLDLAPHGAGRLGLVKRVPVGPVAAISPFNFPLNLSAHKLAPAIAAGNPIVLKPASKTPISALRLGHYLVEAGVPEGALSVLPLSRRDGDRMVGDAWSAVGARGDPAGADAGWRNGQGGINRPALQAVFDVLADA